MFKNHEIISLESTGSTNLHMSELLKIKPLKEGTIVVTSNQTHGKGLENNRWESEPGKNLTATIVLYPAFLKPEHQFQLTKVVSLSVCATLDKYLPPSGTTIKWPNDIYYNNRKIAGILINNEIIGNSLSCAIAGLGLNINQESFSKNAPGATSLRMITGKEFNIHQLLTEWHNNLAFWYKKLKEPASTMLDDAYLKRMYLLNQISDFVIKGKRMKATIRGLAEYGMLLLEDEHGRQYKCSLKEIVFAGNL